MRPLRQTPPEWIHLLKPAGPPILKTVGQGDVGVWHATLEQLTPWGGPFTRDVAYGKGKATVVGEDGRSASAEVVVAQRLSRGPWEARSLLIHEKPPDHWRPYVAMLSDDGVFPPRIRQMLNALGRPGAPDVIAWNGPTEETHVIAVECKRTGKDAIRGQQAAWYARAFAELWLEPGDLVVAEWSVAS